MTNKEIENMIRRINDRMVRIVDTLGIDSGAYKTYLAKIKDAEKFYGITINREGLTYKIERSKANIDKAQTNINSMKMLEQLDKKTRNSLSNLMATARKELRENPAFGPQRKTPYGKMDRRDIVQRAKLVDYVNYWIEKRWEQMYMSERERENANNSEEAWEELYQFYKKKGFGAGKGFSYEEWYEKLKGVEG